MYRLIPLRLLRRTSGVKFDEMYRLIPLRLLDGYSGKLMVLIELFMLLNSISPGPEEDWTPPVKRPYIAYWTR